MVDPSVRPETDTECDVPPVVVKVVGSEPYTVFALVPYLHVAFSFVVTLSVAERVPAERFCVAVCAVTVGGVVSPGIEAGTLLGSLVGYVFVDAPAG